MNSPLLFVTTPREVPLIETFTISSGLFSGSITLPFTETPVICPAAGCIISHKINITKDSSLNIYA